MEILKTKNLRNNGKIFRKVEGVVFCRKCGSEFNDMVNKRCIICGEDNSFIYGELASRIGGYLDLHRKGLLKKYYDTIYKKKSIIRMNDKRIMMRLLINDKLIEADDKEMEDIIYRIMWRKF